MEPRQVLNEIRDSGASVCTRDQKLMVQPMSVISKELKQQISYNRDAMFTILQTALDCLVTLATSKAWTLYEQRVAESEVLHVLGDTYGINFCTDTELDGWACALAIRTLQARQQVPKGWDKIANCKKCGPVWSEHELPTLSCGWCWMRVDGKPYPQPDTKNEE